MEPLATISYKVRISSRHPHVASRIRALLTTSDHDESTLDENEYDLYECSDEVEFLSVTRHDQWQTAVEYEAGDTPRAHANFVKALKGFPETSVRVLDEMVV